MSSVFFNPTRVPPGAAQEAMDESRRSGRTISLREHLGVDDPEKRVAACVREIRGERSKCEPRAALVDLWTNELAGAFAVLSLVKLLALASGSPR